MAIRRNRGSRNERTPEQNTVEGVAEHVADSLPDDDRVTDDVSEDALREITRLTNRLIETTHASLTRAKEGQALQGALRELRATAREIAGTARFDESSTGTPTVTPVQERPCGCEPSCDGTPAGCCCFEVVLLRALVYEEQKLPEIADGAGPGQGNALELIFNILADGEGECYPGLTSNFPIEKKQGWVAINKRIRKICIRCGETRSVPLTVEVMEIEELAAGGRPEFGSNFGSLTLRCGCPTAPAIVEVHMTGGGITEGKVWVEVGARQI